MDNEILFIIRKLLLEIIKKIDEHLEPKPEVADPGGNDFGDSFDNFDGPENEN